MELYPQFYWNSIAPHIQTAIKYLNLTSSGRQWVASLYSNVFSARADPNARGPASLATRLNQSLNFKVNWQTKTVK
jgi:uncharacterized protein (DUF2132 family)